MTRLTEEKLVGDAWKSGPDVLLSYENEAIQARQAGADFDCARQVFRPLDASIKPQVERANDPSDPFPDRRRC